MREALAYAVAGFCFLAFFVADDIRHGRAPQKRDLHLIFFWPLIAFIALLIGLCELSRVTSTPGGGWVKRPGEWL